jgi:hypothetical protein
MVGLFTLAMGIILSSIPWLDYIILKVSLSFAHRSQQQLHYG